MKSLTMFFVLGFLFISQKGNAQNPNDVLRKSQGKYFYKNRVYKKKELGKLFQLDEASYKYYKKYRKANAIFKASAISTILVGGVGLILLSDNNGGNHTQGDPCYEFCPHQIFGLYMFLASFLPATATLISFPISRVNYRRTMKSFKMYAEENPTLGSAPLELKFNYTGNGIGLVLNF